MTAPLRIAIATNGRFHVLDLARELDRLGHHVTFYSLLPKWRSRQFGLSADRCVSLFWVMLPFIAWQRIAPRFARDRREHWSVRVLDWATGRVLRPCDVFIGMSGLMVSAAVTARRKYGARIFIERGSKHIAAQAEILALQGAATPSADDIAREYQSYAVADRIMIPADHVRQSFARDPAAAAKLMINPYGVDLDQFPQRAFHPGVDNQLLFVGGWLLRKGVDLFADVLRRLPDVRLTHVGGRGDTAMPDVDRFTHVDPVDQRLLTHHYAQAAVFVMPSREEGLALVQLQALASGLALVCSDQTGGRDLCHTPGLSERIFEVPVDDTAALVAATERALARVATLPRLGDDDRATLSWQAYAKRYEAHIMADRQAATRP
jgi:starch synthase